MIKVTKELKFCCAHRLMGHQGACVNLHGHNYKVFITLSSGNLDALGMVIDFSIVKKTMQSWLDTVYDHKTVLNNEDPLVEILRLRGFLVTTIKGNPTAENMANDIFKEAVRVLIFPGIHIDSVTVYETDTSYAEAF